MDEDKNIRAELKLENFALATTSPVNGEEDIPYNLKKIILTFNNKLGISTTYPQINFSKVNASDDEGIDNRDFEIEDNQLIINLGGNFLDNSYLEFGEEYELEITNRILDEKGRSFAVPNIKFKIETVAPEAPFVGIDLIDANNQLEIFWQRTKDNLKGLGDKYAVEYRIYRSINDKEFSDEPYKIISLAEGDFQLDDLEIILREDINEDVDLFTNIYYYKVRAVNEYGKVSEFSNIVSTE
nr:Ig-like domain-containing protein [Halanaerobacter jeridensis]